MHHDEYLRHDATALAAAVARGEVSAPELLSLALQQLDRVEPHIQSLARLMEGEARAQIDAWPPGRPAGVFGGVPFLVKDAVHDIAGLPTGQGSRAFTRVATEDSSIVRRLKAAGLVIFGKTRLPELALKGVTDPRAQGRSRNPWHLDHTPGGSSGGAAAAVAAGVVPMAAGNDGGGSIRIPAACCGLFGLRPSRGRVSPGPAIGEVWYGASSDGVISRSVRDSALALDVLAGPEPGDPFRIPTPSAPYAALVRQPPPRLRIAYSTTSPLGTPVDAEAVAAVEHTVDLLRQLGHEVVPGAPDIDGRALAQTYLHLYFGVVAAGVSQAREQGARESDFEPLTRVLAALGRATSAGTATRHLWRWNDFARALGRFHEQHDLLLTPTLAGPPVKHGTGDPPAWQESLLTVLCATGLLGGLHRLGVLAPVIDQIALDSLRHVPFTQLANLTGTPAMSVPLHWCANGLPLGVQFIARFGEEAVLLQLAAQLEQAQPWFERLPPLAHDTPAATVAHAH